MTPALKALAERALLRSGVAAIARTRIQHRSLILAYHNIVPRGENVRGDSSLHLRATEFARQLDALAESHDVVSVDELFHTSQTPLRPRAAITFDDAYVGAVTAGVDELAKRGMPATIFVAPALLGGTTWWDMLADANSGVVPSEARAWAIRELGGRQAEVVRWAQANSFRSITDSALPRISREPDLLNAAKYAGITLGSHSWSHPNLSVLAARELRDELLRPLEWLRARSANTVSWLSYPYGLFSESVQKAAAKSGYTGALRIDGGYVLRAQVSPSFATARVNIPAGLSINGFRLRLAGIGVGR